MWVSNYCSENSYLNAQNHERYKKIFYEEIAALKEFIKTQTVTSPDYLSDKHGIAFAYNQKEHMNDETIVIPNNIGIYQLGNMRTPSLFSECKKCKKVIIERGVGKISNYTFSCMPMLETISLPTSIVYIGEGAFRSCFNLKKFDFPRQIHVIYPNTFADCYNLEKVTLPPFLVSILPNAFENCQSLRTIDIPESTQLIGESAFQGCSDLREVIIRGFNTKLQGDNIFNIRNNNEVMIVCQAGSQAEKYAIEHNLSFRHIGKQYSSKLNYEKHRKPDMRMYVGDF